MSSICLSRFCDGTIPKRPFRILPQVSEEDEVADSGGVDGGVGGGLIGGEEDIREDGVRFTVEDGENIIVDR